MPATAGPKSLPRWWNTRLSTIAVMLPSVMPLPKMICAHSGTALATSGSAVTYMARPTLVATMTTLRWSWKSTRESVWNPTTATVANIASAAPPSTGCGIPATIAAAFGSNPRMIMIDPGGGHDVAALHPGQPDQADVLGEAGVGERVQDAAEGGGQAVGAQRAGDVLAHDALLHDLAGGEHVTGGLDGGDQHDHDHRDDRGQRELGPAEVERRGHAEPGGGGHRVEVGVAQDEGHHGPDDQADQHGDGGHEALEHALDEDDQGQRAQGVGHVPAAGRVERPAPPRPPRPPPRPAAARCR